MACSSIESEKAIKKVLLSSQSGETVLRGKGIRFLGVTFAVAAMIRLIPELVAYPIPIGFDTVSFYAPSIEFFPTNLTALFVSPIYSPLFYLLLRPLTVFMGVFDAIRIASCTLYGLLASSIYVFSRRRLNWSPKLSVLAAVFIVSYFVTLRIGWDLFKNGLGLVLTILILSYFPKEEVKRRDFAALGFASVLLSLTHQLSYLFFLAVIALVATPQYLLPWRGWRKFRDVVWLLPSFVIFLLTYIGFYLPPQFPAADGVNVSFASVGYIPASISPFINYLSMYQGSYGALGFDVLSVFAFLYLPVIPFAFVGRFRQRILFAWTAIALLISFQVLLTPSFGFWYWDRWMLLLFLPLLLYAVEGIRRIISKIRLKTVKVIALLLIVTPFAFVNSGFMLLPPDHAFLYFRDPTIWPHFQSSMLSNTLPLQDTQDALNVLAALNLKMNSSTVLLVHQAFYGWAVLTATGKTNIIDYFLGNPDEVVQLALERGFKVIYTIWWTNGYGWYGQQMPNDFKVILTYGRIAAYLYIG